MNLIIVESFSRTNVPLDKFSLSYTSTLEASAQGTQARDRYGSAFTYRSNIFMDPLTLGSSVSSSWCRILMAPNFVPKNSFNPRLSRTYSPGIMPHFNIVPRTLQGKHCARAYLSPHHRGCKHVSSIDILSFTRRTI